MINSFETLSALIDHAGDTLGSENKEAERRTAFALDVAMRCAGLVEVEIFTLPGKVFEGNQAIAKERGSK